MDEPLSYTIGQAGYSKQFWLVCLFTEIIQYKSWMNIYTVLLAQEP
jgi:hypothetical protein